MDLRVNDFNNMMPPKVAECIYRTTGQYIIRYIQFIKSELKSGTVRNDKCSFIMKCNILGETSLAYCYEAWGEHGRKRIFYSIFSLVVQFILPLTLIGLANYAIKRKLQNLPR